MQELSAISRAVLALVFSLFLFMGGIIMPAAGFIVLPLVPQPALSLGFRFGFAWGVMVLVGSGLVIAILAGKEMAALYGLFALIAGLLFGSLGRLRRIEFLVTAVAGVIYLAAGSLMVYFFGSWAEMVRQVRESLRQHLASAVAVYEKMGVPQESLDLLREQIPQLGETLLMLLPGLFFLGLVFMVLVNVLLLCKRFPDRRDTWISIKSLREWKGPEPLVWGLIASGFALFAPGLTLLQPLALNLLVVIAACYFAQGIAIIAFFFHKNNVPLFLRGLTYALIVFQQFLTLLVVGLGLFDLWGDFRRLRKDNLTPSQAA